MSTERVPDYSLFFEILRALEEIQAPYMIIGAFAAALYGSNRVTYDIDIVVDLSESNIQQLVAAFPAPRYYADPDQMRDSIRMGIMFNIIDSSRGEKADLVPLTMASAYRRAFERRVRQEVELSDGMPFQVWCARPEDIIIGKLTAWEEGRSRKHESDILDMLVNNYLEAEAGTGAPLAEEEITQAARRLGMETTELWEAIRAAAQRSRRES